MAATLSAIADLRERVSVLEFERRLTRLSRKHQQLVREYLGTPADPRNVPESVWQEIERQHRAALMILLFGAAIPTLEVAFSRLQRTRGETLDQDDVRDQLERLSRRRADWVSESVTNTTRDRLDRGFENGRDLDDVMREIFEEDRWTAVARNESVAAQSAGGSSVAEAARNVGIPVTEIWYLGKCEHCDTCPMLHGTSREFWGLWTQGPPLHPHCCCHIQVFFDEPDELIRRRLLVSHNPSFAIVDARMQKFGRARGGGSTTITRSIGEFLGFTKAVEPKDGDGDGLVFDGTEQERPVDEQAKKQQAVQQKKTKDQPAQNELERDFYLKTARKHQRSLQTRRQAALEAIDNIKDQTYEITMQHENLNRELRDIQTQIDKSIAQGQSINQMTEKLGQKKGKFAEILAAGDKNLSDRKNALIAKMTDLENKRTELQSGINDKFRQALGISSSSIDPKVSTKHAKANITQAITEGTAIVKNWTSGEILKNVETKCVSITSFRPDVQSKLGDTTRSFVYDRGRKMALSETVSASVVAHEFGHVIEYQNPHIHRLAKGFLADRVGDEKPTRLADKFEGYGSTEFGRKDSFDRVFDEHSAYYIGKQYDDATEVISMGLEQLHRDPVKFAENDPEYFDLMIGALQGVLR